MDEAGPDIMVKGLGDATGAQAPIDFASRVAAGQLDASTLRWLQQGMAAWVRSGCDISLERCLHLPRSRSQLRLMQRNFWIMIAAGRLNARSDGLLAAELAEHLARFVSRGPWVTWRALTAPPKEASKLRAALFEIARRNNGKSLSVRHLNRIIDTFSGGSVRRSE